MKEHKAIGLLLMFIPAFFFTISAAMVLGGFKAFLATIGALMALILIYIGYLGYSLYSYEDPS